MSDIAMLVTAVATAVTAIFALLQFLISKRLADPYLAGDIKKMGDGLLLLTVRIYPAEYATRYCAISVRSARIAPAEGEYDTWTSTAKYRPAHKPRSGRLSVDVSLPPSSISPKPAVELFVLEGLRRQSSLAISLHTRFMCFPVKHKITAITSSAPD